LKQKIIYEIKGTETEKFHIESSEITDELANAIKKDLENIPKNPIIDWHFFSRYINEFTKTEIKKISVSNILIDYLNAECKRDIFIEAIITFYLKDNFNIDDFLASQEIEIVKTLNDFQNAKLIESVFEHVVLDYESSMELLDTVLEHDYEEIENHCEILNIEIK